MNEELKFLTPENCLLRYELAGLGSRFAAFLIDIIIIVHTIIIIELLKWFVMPVLYGEKWQNHPVHDLWLAIEITFGFFVFFLYPILFETFNDGRTIGKIIFNIKVIKQNGEPVGFIESFVRNILRFIDIVPIYLLGAGMILFTKEHKRIGDFGAGTIVVKHRKVEKPSVIKYLANESNLNNKVNNNVVEERIINEYPVIESEYSLLREYISRRENLGNRRYILAQYIANYFITKYNFDKQKYSNPDLFLEDILKMNSGISG